MSKPLFRGAATALITPFNDRGVDYDAFAEQIEFQIANGISALIVCGTTGEPATMTAAERAEVIKFVIDRTAKRVPVIAGCGTNCTATTVEGAIQAQKLGADGLLVVTPYYNKCTQNGLIAHFKAVADSVSIPIILYNVPGRTGVNILPATYQALLGYKNIVATKEACGSIEQIMDVARLCGGKMDIYSGDDAVVLPLLTIGGLGVISVSSNIIPRQMSDLCEAFFKGNLEEARKIQYAYANVIKNLFVEVNPIPVKHAMNLMGLKAGSLRMPLTEIEADNGAKLKKAMQEVGLVTAKL